MIRNKIDESYDDFDSKIKSSVSDLVENNDLVSLFYELRVLLTKYYKFEKQKILSTYLGILDKYNSNIFNILNDGSISPIIVLGKIIKLTSIDEIYNDIISIKEENIKDEYLYNLYRYISINELDNSYNFANWLKEKMDKSIKITYSRDATELRFIARSNGIEYIDLIRQIFNKRKYNPFIAQSYLSTFVYKPEKFRELLNLKQPLAIDIYEFLTDNNVHDYQYECLKLILENKPNYAKIVAKKFISNKNNSFDEISLLLNNSFTKTFFNACMHICTNEKLYYPPFHLSNLISKNITNKFVQEWISNYIDSNYRNNFAMTILFSILSESEYSYRNRYLIQYYLKGNNDNIIICALLRKVHSYSNPKSYYNNEINELKILKKKFIDLNKLNVVNFINELIDSYESEIKKTEIDNIIDYDYKIFKELRDMDYKTEISSKEAFNLYCNDNDFRSMINSGYVSYQDNSFITIKEEPVKFEDVLKNKKSFSIKVKTDSSYEEYLSSMKSIVNRFENENIVTINDCILSLFEENDWTYDDFKSNTYLSRDLFSKIKNHNKRKMEKRTLVQILIGLKLPKYQYDYLLKLNGTPLLDTNENDVLYDFILASKMDIETALELTEELNKDILTCNLG